MAMLYLALSCLQGRPMARAYDDLAPLADGVQLCPGCQPTPGFAPTGVVRTHHGYTPHAFRTRAVWGEDGACLVDSDSVHPPLLGGKYSDTPILETMYPSYELGDGDALEAAMARGVRLAVDVSHLWIQKTQGVISERQLAKVFDYSEIAEIHVSANDGKRDLHAPLRADTYGLDWARQRGVPVVLECYFHKLDDDARKRQVELARPTC